MRFYVFLAICLLVNVPCSADIITVDDDGPANYSKIQDAINAANNGDTIIVQPGNYIGTGNKNLDFTGKPITVQSANPDDPCVVAATIIDCENSGRGFYFHSGEDCYSIVDGLTITRGYADNGGAIACISASPTIRSCAITANTSQNGTDALYGGDGYHGGGIYCQSSSAKFENCHIASNAAGNGGNGHSIYDPMGGFKISGRGGAGGHGGGLYLLDSSVQLVKCVLTSNGAGRGGHYQDYENAGGNAGNGGCGGGIFCSNSSLNVMDLRIADTHAGSGGNAPSGGTAGNGGSGGGIFASNVSVIDISFAVITGNNSGQGGFGDTMGESGDGGGIYCLSSSITVSNTAITHNWAAPDFGYGGGIGLNNCSLATFTNCVIASNVAYGRGGGMMVRGNVDIRNSTITSNSSFGMSESGGLYVYDGNQTIIDSIIWDNGPDAIVGSANITFSDVDGGWTGDGNINGDPLFVDAANGNLRLLHGSPCIDAGDNDSVPPDNADLDNDGNTIEPIPFDLNEFPRFNDDCWTVDTGNGTPPIVDMGAYEYLSSDIDSSGNINFEDFCLFATYWMDVSCGRCSGADLTCDGDVDFDDLEELVSYWMAGIP